MHALAGWATDSGIEDGIDADDKVFPVGQFRKSWAKLRRNARLEHIVFHDLRHHFASTLVLLGKPLSVVKELMGHKHISTTELYLSVRMEDKFEAVELL